MFALNQRYRAVEMRSRCGKLDPLLSSKNRNRQDGGVTDGFV
ncbi:hypothetical protein [Kamptonema sp. UHCC 0994]|nr:hypothetical protein [Kamptonema sp. UHCC 0994]MDF0556010.1 hypothetical protein [Kamptonema sp. UHCC 0994]